jgi:signal transduction histidine kinase
MSDADSRRVFVDAVQNLQAVPTLLQVLCDTTGMGFAAVARVTDDLWMACAVHDRINFGLKAGEELDVHTTLCKESRQAMAAVAIDHASQDPVFSGHHTPRIYNIESYVSVPIVLPDGEYFGNLCAIDPAPADVSNVKVQAMFARFAGLIGAQLGIEFAQAKTALLLDEARSATELREQFVAVLGHDLRNPLSAVMACSDMLGRRAEDPVRVRELAHRVKESAKRMSTLIDDVLDFTRTRLGEAIGVKMVEVDLSEALASVIEESRFGNPERMIVGRIASPLIATCDVGRIQQVVSNLIANAVAHGAATSAIEVNARMLGTDLVMSVWNDGDPIPADTMAKMFSPFWRNTTSRNRQGLGLGLHICNEIVASHHGTFSAKSSATEGTTFTVVIPHRP